MLPSAPWRSSAHPPLSALAFIRERPALVALALIGLAAALRLSFYAFNPPIWIDEAWLSLNVVERSWSQLLRPLQHAQGAPFGFLALLRIAYGAGGDVDLLLRLWPLIASLLALPLFYAVARRILPAQGALLALALFALSAPLIRYSGEVKQYSTDVLAMLLLTWAALRVERVTPRAVLGLGLLGAVVIWFSHPVVFALASIGLALAARELRREGPRALPRLILLGALWLASFTAEYLVQVRDLTSNTRLQSQWQAAFVPVGRGLIPWAREHLSIFDKAVGFGVLPEWLFAAAACAAVVHLCLRRRGWVLALLVGPMLIALAASALHLYPLKPRMLLFAVPAILLLIAHAATLMPARLARAAAGGVLLGSMAAGLLLYRDSPRLEVRPAIRYIQAHGRPGDVVYVTILSRDVRKYSGWVVRLYARRHGLEVRDAQPEDVAAWSKRVSRDPPGRVWHLLSTGDAVAVRLWHRAAAGVASACPHHEYMRLGDVELYRYDLPIRRPVQATLVSAGAVPRRRIHSAVLLRRSAPRCPQCAERSGQVLTVAAP